MIEFTVTHQLLKLTGRPYVVGNTNDYLTAEFGFTDDWNGFAKVAYFAQGDDVYAFTLVDDMIAKDQHLNLASGEWMVWCYGFGGEVEDPTQLPTDVERISTNAIYLMVEDNGSVSGEIIPITPPTMGEQILALAQDALNTANEALAIAEGVRHDIDVKWGSAARRIPVDNTILDYIIMPNKQGLFYGYHIPDSPGYNAYYYFQVVSYTNEADPSIYYGTMVAWSAGTTATPSFGVYRRRYNYNGWADENWVRIYDETHQPPHPIQPLYNVVAPTASFVSDAERVDAINAYLSLMNKTAKSIGMVGTVYNSPSGRQRITEGVSLQSKYNSVTCAHDQLRLLALAWHSPAALEAAGTYDVQYDVYGLLQDYTVGRDYDKGEVIQRKKGIVDKQAIKCKVNDHVAAEVADEDWAKYWENSDEPLVPCWRHQSVKHSVLDDGVGFEFVAAKSGSTKSNTNAALNYIIDNRPEVPVEPDALPDSEHRNGAYNMSAIVRKNGKTYAVSVLGLEDDDYNKELCISIIRELVELCEIGCSGDMRDFADYHDWGDNIYKSQLVKTSPSIPFGQIHQFYCPSMAICQLIDGNSLEEDLAYIDDTALYLDQYKQRVALSATKLMNACVASRYADTKAYIRLLSKDRVGGSGKPFGDDNIITLKDALAECLAASDNAVATSIASNIGKGAGSDVFIAVRGTTPYADIISALAEGKMVVCKAVISGSTIYMPYVRDYAAADDTTLRFASVYMTPGAAYIANCAVTTEDGETYWTSAPTDKMLVVKSIGEGLKLEDGVLSLA